MTFSRNVELLWLALLVASSAACTTTPRHVPPKVSRAQEHVKSPDVQEQELTKGHSDPSSAPNEAATNHKPTREEYIAELSANCASGDSWSCGKLGWGYDKGDFGEPDFKKAETFYSRQCELGDANGCLNLGVLAGNGNLGHADRERSARLYIRACGMDPTQACGDAAFRLAHGDGVAKDLKLAIQYGIRGCEVGRAAYACRILGRVYQMNGDLKNAILLARKACDGKTGEACKELGDLLLKQGSQKDAFAAYESAAKYLDPRCFENNEPIPCLVLANMISAGHSPAYTLDDSIRASKIACTVSPVHCDERLMSGSKHKASRSP